MFSSLITPKGYLRSKYMLEGRAMIKEISNKSVVVLTSGGLDSSTTMLRLANEGYRVYPLFVNYGQDAYFMECGAIKRIARELTKRDLSIEEPKVIGIEQIGKLHRKLMGEKRDPFFPFRNLILASIGAFFGYHMGVSVLALGLVKDSYPDCTPDFQKKLTDVLSESVAAKVTVLAPFIDYQKSDIVKYGAKSGFPYNLTYSCYVGENDHCGQCSGCIGRQKAFKEAGIKDPTPKYVMPAMV